MILFMKLKDLHDQVMGKNEIDDIISAPEMVSDSVICVNLNTHVDINLI